MKVFISWSGETSKHVAIALRDWLPNVIQAIEPWMSSEDIAKGARWSARIASELATTSAGIVCVTPDNPTAPWLNFEAGALSKSVVNQEMVCTYLFRMKPSDFTGPLTEFQASLATKDDTRRLIRTLNKAMNDKALPEGKLTQAFDRWWPDLEKSLESIPESTPTNRPARSTDEKIDEVLDIVREQARTMQSFANQQPRIATVNGVRTISIPASMLRGTSLSAPTLLTSTPSQYEALMSLGVPRDGSDLEKPLREDDEDFRPGFANQDE